MAKSSVSKRVFAGATASKESEGTDLDRDEFFRIYNDPLSKDEVKLYIKKILGLATIANIDQISQQLNLLSSKFNISLESKDILNVANKLLLQAFEYLDFFNIDKIFRFVCKAGLSAQHCLKNPDFLKHCTKIFDPKISTRALHSPFLTQILVHINNLGCLEKIDRKILEGFMNQYVDMMHATNNLHNFNDVTRYSFFQITTYCRDVFHMESLATKIDKIAEHKSIRDSILTHKKDARISYHQRQVFKILHDYLSGKTSRDDEEWKSVSSIIDDTFFIDPYKAQLEGEYVGSGGYFLKTIDIMLGNGEDFSVAFEIDGESHFNWVDGKRCRDAATISRDIHCASVLGKVLVIDLREFQNEKGSLDKEKLLRFFEGNLYVKSVRDDIAHKGRADVALTKPKKHIDAAESTAAQAAAAPAAAMLAPTSSDATKSKSSGKKKKSEKAKKIEEDFDGLLKEFSKLDQERLQLKAKASTPESLKENFKLNIKRILLENPVDLKELEYFLKQNYKSYPDFWQEKIGFEEPQKKGHAKRNKMRSLYDFAFENNNYRMLILLKKYYDIPPIVYETEIDEERTAMNFITFVDENVPRRATSHKDFEARIKLFTSQEPVKKVIRYLISDIVKKSIIGVAYKRREGGQFTVNTRDSINTTKCSLFALENNNCELTEDDKMDLMTNKKSSAIYETLKEEALEMDDLLGYILNISPNADLMINQERDEWGFNFAIFCHNTRTGKMASPSQDLTFQERMLTSWWPMIPDISLFSICNPNCAELIEYMICNDIYKANHVARPLKPYETSIFELQGRSLSAFLLLKREDIARRMVESGAIENPIDSLEPLEGFSILYRACELGSFEFVDFILRKGAETNRPLLRSFDAQKPKAQLTAVIGACHNKNPAVMQLLIDRGADIEVGINKGEGNHLLPVEYIASTLFYEDNQPSFDIFKLLFEKMIENKSLYFPEKILILLSAVTANGRVDIAEFLLEQSEKHFKTKFESGFKENIMTLSQNMHDAKMRAKRFSNDSFKAFMDEMNDQAISSPASAAQIKAADGLKKTTKDRGQAASS